MTDNNSEEKILTQCKRFYKALKNKESDYSIEKKAGIVKYLEKKTCPTYFYFEKIGGRPIKKKKVKGFRDKKHFFQHMESWLEGEAERLLNEQD